MGMRVDNTNPAIALQTQGQTAVSRAAQSAQTTRPETTANPQATTAAKLSVSDRLQAQVRQFTHEAGIYQKGVTAAQVAADGLNKQQKQLDALQEIAGKAANADLSPDQRAELASQARDALRQFGATADTTTFNGTAVLSGRQKSVALDGLNGPQLNLPDTTPKALGLEDIDLSTAESAAAALDTIESARGQVDQARAGVQTQAGRFAKALEERMAASEAAQTTQGQIQDFEVARQTIDQTKAQLRQQLSPSSLLRASSSSQFVADLLGSSR